MSSETIIIRLVDMPCAAKGYIAPDEDGNYNVYINARLSHEEQLDVLLHEIVHATRGDCFADSPVAVLESAV